MRKPKDLVSVTNNMDKPSVLERILKRPGDKLEANMTKSGRKVLKIDTAEVKYSVVQYPTTNTVVETKTTRLKK